MTALNSTARPALFTSVLCGGVTRAPAEGARVGLGRMLIAIGTVVLIAGLLIEFVPGLRLGRLPGDFAFGSGSVRVYIPLGTSIALSVLLTIVWGLLARR
jgi:hypothetical protein